MKKFLLLTSFVGLVLLSGCSKKVGVPNNYISSQFTLAESLLGCDSASVAKKMAKDGWQFNCLDEGVQYIKGNSQATVLFTNYSSGQAIWVAFFFTGDDHADLKNQNKYLEFVKYLGSSYKLQTGQVCSFEECDYSTGGGRYDSEEISDYNQFVNNFNTVYSSQDWIAYWGNSIIFNVQDDGNQKFIYFVIDNYQN